jgi:hypothetical protein
MSIAELKLISIVRGICLLPIIVIYGIWVLFKFTLALIALGLGAWLTHSLFGRIGYALLALPVIYAWSYLVPNPKIFEIPGKLMAVSKSRKKPAVIPKSD